MEIRPALPKDAMAVARVHVRSWQVAYRGLFPDEYLDALRPEDRAPRYDFSNADRARPYTLIAIEAGEILGFATTSPSRDETLPGYGELNALYVAPEHWRKGVGAMLAAAQYERLIQLGFRDALLWLLAGNSQAERFYRAEGWRPDGVRRTEVVWSVNADEQRFVRQLR
jgi:GNAT superfamily N-acetyltransferase